MAIVDPRVSGAMVALGYHQFPFGSYDQTGRVIIPGGIEIPAALQADFGAAQSAPLWQEVFRRLSVLDNVEPPWKCYAVGVGFGRSGIRLMPVKSLGSVSSPQAAAQWVNSLGEVIMKGIREVSGRQPRIQPSWITSLRTILSLLKGKASAGHLHQPAGQEHEQAQLGRNSEHPSGFHPPQAGEMAIAAAFSPALAVSILLELLEAAQTLTKARNVFSTNIWFAPEGWPAMTFERTAPWSTLARPWQSGPGGRAVNAIWSPESTRLWHWNALHAWNEGWPGLKMPHNPNQVAGAFFPAGRGLADAPAEDALAADAASGATD